MRITSFHVDGFGILHDQGISEVDPGLNVFEGANESGKSTLVEFFRFAFFGPAGRGGKIYPALRGGRPGGRLRLLTRAGRELLLERDESGARAHDAALADGSQADLDEWLGGLDRKTFERVFAIGLEDLQGLDVLTEEELRGRLLAAGSGLGRVDLPRVLGTLDRERRELLLLRGKKPGLNQLLGRARELDEQVSDLQRLSERYSALEGRRRELSGELEQAQRLLRRAETRRRLLQVLQQAREPWMRWRNACQEIERLALAAPGEEPDLDALAQWEREVAELEQQRHAVRMRIARLEQRRNDQPAFERDAEPDEESQESRAAGEPNDGTERAGDEAEAPRAGGGQPAADGREDDDGAGAGRRAQGSALPDVSAELLARRRRALSRLRALVQRRDLLAVEARRLEDVLGNLDEQQSALRRRLRQPTTGLPLWALPVVLLLPLVLAAIEPSRGVWLAAAGTVLGWILIVLGFRRHQRRLSEQRRAELESELEGLDQRTLHVSQELLDVQAKASELPGALDREAERVGWESPGMASDLERLSEELEEHAATLETRRQIDLRLDEERAQADALEQRLDDSRRTLDVLLEAAGASDPADYRRRARDRRKLDELEQQRGSLRLGLDVLLGTGDEGRRLEAELERSEPTRLQSEQAELDSRTSDLADSLRAGREELGSINAELEHLAADDRLGARLLERQVVERRIDEGLRSWATLVLARELLEEARESYETRRQPRVLRRAGEHLETMTGGRYRLLSCAATGGVVLEDERMERKSEGEWSSGLADLVYLALRLALAEELGRHREPLPLFLDDVLVRCDPERRDATARVLVELGRTQQIFFFTCYPDSRRALAAAANGAIALVRLRDGRLEPEVRASGDRV